MKNSQKNGNKRKSTQGKKNVLSGSKQKTTRRRKRNAPKGKERNGLMTILVSDPSHIAGAEIFGTCHFPGKKKPRHRVVVAKNPERQRYLIGAKRAMVYSIAA